MPAAATMEQLEGRTLLAFSVNLNFQPAGSPVPEGYIADVGDSYAQRNHGLKYGWRDENQSRARDRNHPDSPDQRYDTLNHLADGSRGRWAIDVPNGAYRVRLVAGDPMFFDSVFRIGVEDVVAIDQAATSTQRFVENTLTVAVSDGALTIHSLPGAKNNKLSFVEIQQVSPPPAPPAVPTEVRALVQSASMIKLVWTDNATDETGYRIERRQGSGNPFVPVAVVAANVTSFVDTRLSAATRYDYRVRSFNAAGVSMHSDMVKRYTLGLTGTQISWRTVAPSPIIRAEALTATVQQKLYVLGGFSGASGPVVTSHVYHPSLNTWEQIPNLPRRLTHAGVTSDDRYIYVAGGYVGTGSGYIQQFGTEEAWQFDTKTRTWSALPDLPKQVASGGLVLLGRNLHYFGGNNSNRQDIGDHYVLNLDNPGGGWSSAAPLPNPRSHMGYAVFGGKIYALVGQTGNDAGLVTKNLVHVWDPASPGIWTQLASAPLSVSHVSSATFVMGDRIIIAGGETADGAVTKNVMAYTPATNTWQTLSPLPAARFSGVATAWDGYIIFTTGSSQTTTWRGYFVG